MQFSDSRIWHIRDSNIPFTRNLLERVLLVWQTLSQLLVYHDILKFDINNNYLFCQWLVRILKAEVQNFLMSNSKMLWYTKSCESVCHSKRTRSSRFLVKGILEFPDMSNPWIWNSSFSLGICLQILADALLLPSKTQSFLFRKTDCFS